jgi:hypothetical protein
MQDTNDEHIDVSSKERMDTTLIRLPRQAVVPYQNLLRLFRISLCFCLKAGGAKGEEVEVPGRFQGRGGSRDVEAPGTWSQLKDPKWDIPSRFSIHVKATVNVYLRSHSGGVLILVLYNLKVNELRAARRTCRALAATASIYQFRTIYFSSHAVRD